MNVIIITRCGVSDTPFLIMDDVTAQATFDKVVGDLLGEDADDINLHDDYAICEVNSILESSGDRIEWFTDVEVNKYVN